MKDRSPWIELHLSVVSHRKTWALADALNIDRVTALGHVCCLWLWAVEQAQDGDLAAFPDRAIAEGAGWRKRATVFVAALVTAGYLTPARTLHEWELYVGPLLEKRRRDRERKPKKGADVAGNSVGIPTEIARNSDGRSGDLARHRLPSTSPSTSPHLDGDGDGQRADAREDGREHLRSVAVALLAKAFAVEPAHKVTWAAVDALEEFGEECVLQALRDTVTRGGRSWSYTERVLETYRREGITA